MSILSKKTGYIDYNSIFEDDVQIYMILGQRSDGKTYGAIKDSIEEYVRTGTPSAYIRRFSESITKSLIQDLVRPHCGLITKLSDGKYTGTSYRSKRFYFSDYDDNKDKNAFLYTFALNTWETAKGADSGKFHNIIFDEYVSDNKYLPSEYSIFENVLSSILRNRGDSRLIMLGNPINQICPYFDEFNIKPHELKQGDIVYRESSDGYKMKFIFVPPMNSRIQKSAKFFSFGKSESIKKGYWEFGEFTHPQSGLVKSSEWLFNFGICFKSQYAICDFYATKDGIIFCVFRPANADIWESDMPLFSDANIYTNNVFLAWERNLITVEFDKCLKNNRVLFATNQVGNLIKMWYNEFVRNSGRLLR